MVALPADHRCAVLIPNDAEDDLREREAANGRYVLDENGEPRLEPSLMRWASWFETSSAQRRVAWTDVYPFQISTIFMGLDHSFFRGPPLLFETMVFWQRRGRYHTRRYALQQWRTFTRAESHDLHAEAVADVRAGRIFFA